MNVNWDNKCVFMCHPQTGEKDISEYFGKIGFVTNYSHGKSVGEKINRKRQSTNFLLPWIFDDFKLIVSIDNPYRRIVNEYKSFSRINWKIKSYTKEFLSKSFNKKFDEMLSDDLFVVNKLNRDKEGLYNFLLPYDFNIKYPDYFIRLETLVEDIYKIDILDHQYHNFHLVDQIDLSDKYKDVFSYENARVIYKVHRHIFDTFDYDPFSFTTRELSREEKIKFIHY